MEDQTMSIERDPTIEFHDFGTLTSVTRWIRTHDEGIAEWLKNARRAYQIDRANVEEKHRVAVLLFKDEDTDGPARIGLLDVGGAALEDVTRWSIWQDPEASGRGSTLPEEETHGNGGKAYMYRLFKGLACILGVRDGKLNCKGFEGSTNTLERGTPGFIPDAASARDLPIASWEAEIRRALAPYLIRLEDLPREVRIAIQSRKAFTLVEGVDPVEVYRGRIDVEDLVRKVLRHDQSALAVQQLRLHGIHNGRLMNSGRMLELEAIPPYPGFETPLVYELPDELPDDNGVMQSTTLNGTRSKGRAILYTSKEDMPRAYKNLKPRWKVIYRTEHQMVGSKPVAELVPTTPGSYFIYARVELSALEPDYVELERKRPLPGPLVEAVDRFVAEKIRALAKEITDRRRHELDQEALDQVHDENRKLDRFKNFFLPSGGPGGNGTPGEGERGPKKRKTRTTSLEYGKVPDTLELEWEPTDTLRIGKGVALHLVSILDPQVLDAAGRVVPRAELEWCSADHHIVSCEEGGVLKAAGKGTTDIWVRVKGTAIQSPKIKTEVWVVDHVLLTPRNLEIMLGKRQQIIAEVTNDEGFRATDVFLSWKHDADDQLIVRISPKGWVTGNRLGRTNITAGAGDQSAGGVWARVRVEAIVVPNPEQPERGGGFPELRLTGRDIDPATGEVRQGDPDQPPLWQEVSDYQHNIWWLNLASPEAAFFVTQRAEDIRLWRAFHAQKVVDMVIQVHMKEEFDAKGDGERPDLWNRHKAVLETWQVLITQAMWEKLQTYVLSGGGLD
jgi:hypothetical protein